LRRKDLARGGAETGRRLPGTRECHGDAAGAANPSATSEPSPGRQRLRENEGGGASSSDRKITMQELSLSGGGGGVTRERNHEHADGRALSGRKGTHNSKIERSGGACEENPSESKKRSKDSANWLWRRAIGKGWNMGATATLAPH
jgi:hypothetical protein